MNDTCALCGRVGMIEGRMSTVDGPMLCLCHNEERDCYFLATVCHVPIEGEPYGAAEIQEMHEQFMPHRFGAKQ